MNDESASPKNLLPPQLGAIAVGGPSGAKPLMLPTLEDVQRLAKLVMASGLIPRTLDTPEKISIALLHGMEIGLPPMMSLQKIAVINNMPSLWGDGALALVEASGRLLYMDEYIEGRKVDDPNTHAVCELQRKGKPKPIKRIFSIGDAIRAGLLSKGGPWKSMPLRMLQMRARGFALRDAFPDVLGGLYLHEEMEGVEVETPPQQAMKNITPKAPEGPPPAPPAPPKAPAKEAPPFPGDIPITADGEIIDAEYDKEIDDGLPPEEDEEGELFASWLNSLDDYSDSELHLNDWRRIIEDDKAHFTADEWNSLIKTWSRKMAKVKGPFE